MLKRAPMFKRIKVGREGGREGRREGGSEGACLLAIEMIRGVRRRYWLKKWKKGKVKRLTESTTSPLIHTSTLPPSLPPRSGRSTTATCPSSGPGSEAKQQSSCKSHRQEQQDEGGGEEGLRGWEGGHQGWAGRWEGGVEEGGEDLC